MALHHSTHYNVDGGPWILITADEEAGPGKSYTITGLSPGSYQVRLKITPLTGTGPAVISDPTTLIVGAATSYVIQVQAAQTQAATGVIGYYAAGFQIQAGQTQAAEGTLLLSGTVSQTQAVQAQAATGTADSLGPLIPNLADFETTTGITNLVTSIALVPMLGVNATVNASAKTISGFVAQSTFLAGMTVEIAGFVNGGNNGDFLISAANSTTLTFATATTFVNETHTANFAPINTWVPWSFSLSACGRLADAGLSGSFVGQIQALSDGESYDIGAIVHGWTKAQIDATDGVLTWDMKIINVGGATNEVGYLAIQAFDSSSALISETAAGEHFCKLFGSSAMLGANINTSIAIASPSAGTVYNGKTYDIKTHVTNNLTGAYTWTNVSYVNVAFSAYSEISGPSLIKYYIDNFR